MSQRLNRGEGKDMGGRTVRDRTGGMNADLLSPLEKGMVIKQMRGREPKTPTKGAEPMADPRVTGSKEAYNGRDGAPTIYKEKQGGRMGGRGKRV